MDTVSGAPESGQAGVTRHRLLALLRRNPRTVPELAAALSLTTNAVRTHIATLERDRLVAPHGQRPTARRPATLYTLTPLADELLTKPYAAVLSAVLETMKERYGERALTDQLREIGARLGRARVARVAGLSGRARVEAIAGVIGDLGGVVDVGEHEGRFVLIGYSCPLVAVVADHASVCSLTGSLIETLLDRGNVRECCERRDGIRCRFVIDLDARAPTAAGLNPPISPVG